MTDSTTLAPCPRLEPCPWCGNVLHVVWRKSNPRASCKTEGCYGLKMAVVNLDDPSDVAAWNRRAPAPASSESEPLITIESSLRFRLACAKDDVEQLEIENREVRERVAKLKAAPASQPVVVPAVNLEALRHSANEWADMAINGLQWLRNIVDGTSEPKSALANMERCMAHCREVNDSADVQDAVKAAAQVQAMLARGLAPGWQAVPVEPTEAMERAMAAQFCGTVDEVR